MGKSGGFHHCHSFVPGSDSLVELLNHAIGPISTKFGCEEQWNHRENNFHHETNLGPEASFSRFKRLPLADRLSITGEWGEETCSKFVRRLWEVYNRAIGRDDTIWTLFLKGVL